MDINPEIIQKILYILVIVVWWWFVFFETEKLEKFLLWNFTKIILWLIFIFLFVNFNFIEISKDTFYIIWWLFAFWYWYKRYQRDKDIEILEKFQIEENIIITDYKNFLNKLELLHVYNKKDYINDEYYDILLKSFLEKLSKLEYEKEAVWIFIKIRTLKKYDKLFEKILDSLKNEVSIFIENNEWVDLEKKWVKIWEDYKESLKKAINANDDLIKINRIFKKEIEEFEALKKEKELQETLDEVSEKTKISKRKLFMYYTYQMLEIN